MVMVTRLTEVNQSKDAVLQPSGPKWRWLDFDPLCMPSESTRRELDTDSGIGKPKGTNIDSKSRFSSSRQNRNPS